MVWERGGMSISIAKGSFTLRKIPVTNYKVSVIALIIRIAESTPQL